MQGKETILDCHIIASPQAYSTWKRNGRAIPLLDEWRYRTVVYEEKDQHKVTLSLAIVNLVKSDYGEYTCEAGNARGKDRETMVLYGMLSNVMRIYMYNSLGIDRASARRADGRGVHFYTNDVKQGLDTFSRGIQQYGNKTRLSAIGASHGSIEMSRVSHLGLFVSASIHLFLNAMQPQKC